jgi:hypothetical protein
VRDVDVDVDNSSGVLIWTWTWITTFHLGSFSAFMLVSGVFAFCLHFCYHFYVFHTPAWRFMATKIPLLSGDLYA